MTAAEGKRDAAMSGPIRFFGIAAVGLSALGAALHLLFPDLGWTAGLRASFGLFFVLFLPGYAAQGLFYERGRLDWVETLGVSVGLSIALVIVTALFTNLVLGIPLTAGTSFLALLVVTLLSFASACLKTKKNPATDHGGSE